MSVVTPFRSLAPRPSESPSRDARAEPLGHDHLLDIATGIAQARELWEGQVRYDGPSRHAVRLIAQASYEVWVIGWPPSHTTTPHDHGGSIGALAVGDGEIVERSGAAGDDGRRLVAGESVFLPVDVVHDVGTTDGTATTIHVYSPPLSTMTFYEEGTGVPDHVLDVVDEEPVVDATGLARALHPARGGRRG